MEKHRSDKLYVDDVLRDYLASCTHPIGMTDPHSYLGLVNTQTRAQYNADTHGYLHIIHTHMYLHIYIHISANAISF